MKKILSIGSIAVVFLLISVSFSGVVSSNFTKESLDELYEVKTSYFTLKGVEEVISYLNEDELNKLKNRLSEMSNALEDNNNNNIERQSEYLKELGIVKDDYDFIKKDKVVMMNSKLNKFININNQDTEDDSIDNYFCYTHFNGESEITYFGQYLIIKIYNLVWNIVQKFSNLLAAIFFLAYILIELYGYFLPTLLSAIGFAIIFGPYVLANIVGRITPLKIMNPSLWISTLHGNVQTIGLKGEIESNGKSRVVLYGFTGICIDIEGSGSTDVFVSGFSLMMKAYD